MDLFSFSLPIWMWVLLVVMLVAGLCAWLVGFLPMRIIAKTQPVDESAGSGPKVSIIALSDADTDPSEFIAAATRQDYYDYEVIIVHESTLAANDMFAEKYAWSAPKTDDDEEPTGCRAVKFCFYPPGAHAISHKKLALSIGIKAASGDVIVTTTTECRIPSDKWLAGMMRHFAPGVDFVLGHVRYDYDELHTGTRPLKRFIHQMTTGQWLAAALRGEPVRGDGNNLAYRRDMFFESKGFADTNDLMNGEDDIFVAANAKDGNVRVDLSDETTLMPEYGNDTQRRLKEARDHYRFTSQRLPRVAFVRQGVASACQWLMVIAAAAVGIYAFPNVAPLAVAMVVLAGVWIVEAFAYKKMADILGDSRKWLLAPLLLLIRPLDNFMFDLSRRDRRFSNYTIRRQ